MRLAGVGLLVLAAIASHEPTAPLSAQGAISSVAGVSTSSWTWLGPDNVGGDVTAIAFHPTIAGTLLAGTAGAGIWRSTDAGAHWTATDAPLGPTIAAIAFNPVSVSTVYAATNTGFINSTDGGLTWTALTSLGLGTSFFSVVPTEVVVSPDGAIVLAAANNSLYRSTDGGANWTAIYVEGTVLDLKFVPGSTSDVVAGTRPFSFDAPGWLYSSDGGATWTRSTIQSGAISAQTSLTQPQGTAYHVAVSPSSPGTVFLTTNSGLLKSTNSGRTYSIVSPTAGDRGLWVDPTNSNVVVLADETGFRRSDDGGSTWTAVVSSLAGTVRAAESDAGYNGTTNKALYIAANNGVFKVPDIRGTTASTPNPIASLNLGLNITLFDHAAAHAASGTILGSAGDKSYVLAAGGSVSSWSTVAGGGFVAIDPTNVNYRYSQSPNSGTPAPSLLRTLDGAATAPEVIDGNVNGTCKPAPYRIDDNCPGSAPGTMSYTLDSLNPNTLIVGKNSVWRTRDARTSNTSTTGPSWEMIRRDIGGDQIASVAVAPSTSDVIWVNNHTRSFLVTQNGTAAQPTWLTVPYPAAPQVFTAPTVTIDPQDGRVVYVSVERGSATPPNVFRTVNLGRTWTPVSGSGAGALHSVAPRVYALAIHPTLSNVLFAGTDTGVYGSADSGATWTSVGPTPVRITDLVWMGTDLVATTRGRGMFRSATTAAPTPPSIVIQPSDVIATPASFTYVTFRVAATGAPAPTYQWQVSSDNGASWSSVTESSTYLGTTLIELTVNAALSSLHRTQYRCLVTNSAGSVTSNAARLFLVGNSDGILQVDTPAASQRVVPGAPFTISGWAIDRFTVTGTGVDAVHVYTTGGGFVGAATYGLSRPDVGAAFGSQFTDSGYTLTATISSASVTGLQVLGRSTVTGGPTLLRYVNLSVRDPVPLVWIDAPAHGAVVNPTFTIAGWAIDPESTSGPGLETVHVYAFPRVGNGFGAGVFLGASYSGSRPDVAAALGANFANSGFSVTTTLPAGAYRVIPYARSSLNGRFYSSTSADVTVVQTPAPEMALDEPANGTTVTGPFLVRGWAVDRGAVGSTGVDTLHVYAFPISGGAPVFLGVPTVGGSRPDVGAVFGTQFSASGYNLNISGLAPGAYDIGVYAHSTVSGSFNQYRIARVTVD